MEYLSDNAYLAIIPEATAGTALKPTTFVPLISESIRTIVNHSADRRFKGLNWKADDLLRGNRMQEGELVVLADPDNLGHFLNMFLSKGSTTGSAPDGFTHPFTVGSADSYTIEIKKGLYTQRLFGVQVDEFRIEFVDGSMQLRLLIRGTGQFSVAKLGIALTGAGMVEIVFQDNYDINPNRGLVVGDVITIGSDDVTLTSVDVDGVTVGFTSLDLTYSANEPIYLKPQTPSYSSLVDPFYHGNLLLGIGANESAATTAAGSNSTATPVHDLVIILRNNLLEIPRTGRLDPVSILPRSKEGEIQLKQLLENEDEKADFLDRTKQAITIIVKGTSIKSDFTTRELLTLKFHNVKLREHSNPLEVGEYVVDDKVYEVLYDRGDAKAMTVDLVNRTDGSNY